MVWFLMDLYVVCINSMKEDTIIWLPSTRQGFQVETYYKALKLGGKIHFLGEVYEN